MSVTRTFTVTVANPGSGNKYYIDTVLQDTVTLGETGTYKFDQSDSSNATHPLRFSTTDDGSHGGGSEYTTGVTTNGTPGNAGAYTQILVAESAPTLYYYCTAHAGMGGQADTVADNTWGIFAWGNNEWGDQGSLDLSITAPATLTSSVGSLSAFNVEGWGRQEWSNSGWGVEYSVALSAPATLTSSIGSVIAAQTIPVPLTGIEATSSLGSLTLDLTSITTLTAPATLTSSVGSLAETTSNVEGWGRQEWGNSGWGVEYSVGLTGLGITSSVGSVVAAQFITAELTAPSTLTASLGSLTSDQLTIVALTAPSQLTSELGDFDNAGTLVGWGRNGWGEEPWGDSFNKLVQPTGLSATASVGAIAPTEMAIGLSGLSVTASVGSIVPAIGVPLTGVDATSSVGSLVIAEGVPLTGIGATASVGAIAPADVIGLTGVGATTGIGEITVTETQLVLPSGVSATASVGAISPTNMSIGLSGLGMTASQGAIVPASAVGLTAPDALTASVGNVAPLGYSRITGTQSAGYSDVTGTQTAGYTSVTSS